MKTLEFIGVILGVTGTIVLSTKLAAESKWRFRIFAVYLASNILMGILMYFKGLYFAVGMNLIYAIASVNGLRTNYSGD